LDAVSWYYDAVRSFFGSSVCLLQRRVGTEGEKLSLWVKPRYVPRRV
jgi:hypothetical protein